ncbi:hypothetical protein BCR32DRAFT_330535 [Anaeromyces robustus]|uniref:Zincin n=1 Tax=Anaeromyces robustus TaxID=1754192 RepID=A0A1Y1VTT0_9FUNG|nr:hypothetical protein BCR32DRAFT_330535 [Anaeromyces robustus]|eukprot:ORX64699.1 hypothetical protein BCR32DRAFT_330535 [Anaeromyces robustus]
MGMATGRLFVEKAFSSDSKEMVEDMIDNIKEAMIKRIPEMEWLDKPTAEYAMKKTEVIGKMIGYPDYINDPTELAKKYEGLESFGEDFFTNIINAIIIKVSNELKSIFEPVSLGSWKMNPQITEAYNDFVRNRIVFPAGILQNPIFDPHNPSYLNYGSFGSVAGHELTHAFDNNGRLFDIEGKFNSWWTNSTDIKFQELAQCFVDEYSSFTIEDKNGKKYNVNGEKTLGENLADNGGVSRAYEAWKISNEKDINTKENNKLLPGLTKYSQDQLFFIAFGQLWCSKKLPEIAVRDLYNKPHSPLNLRVNGVIYNSQLFAEVFNCPADAPMNLKNKCSIW